MEMTTGENTSNILSEVVRSLAPVPLRPIQVQSQAKSPLLKSLEPPVALADPASDAKIQEQYRRWEVLLYACELEWTRLNAQKPAGEIRSTDRRSSSQNLEIAPEQRASQSTSHVSDPTGLNEPYRTASPDSESSRNAVASALKSPPLSNYSETDDPILEQRPPKRKEEHPGAPEASHSATRSPKDTNPRKRPKKSSRDKSSKPTPNMHPKTKGEHEAAAMIMSNPIPRPEGPCFRCLKADQRYARLVAQGKPAKKPQPCLVSKDKNRTKCARCTKSKEGCFDPPQKN
ncbi:hypothetical protein GQ53DRAFT_823278 [Thozetella sp. PMI_491]|nr:hypothetical protein GQ53DRAFT_823278 [Thozetella sp. PMI_491]